MYFIYLICSLPSKSWLSCLRFMQDVPIELQYDLLPLSDVSLINKEIFANKLLESLIKKGPFRVFLQHFPIFVQIVGMS